MTVESTAERSPEQVRLEVFNRYRELFASAPIRLMSRTVSTMRSMGFNDLATAIGDLDWRTVPVEPGDLLFFDSYTPHYSDTNTTSRPRRAAYLTYNAGSLGDHRERYYADKSAEFDRAGGDFDGERVRISISDDFLGRPVPDDRRG